MAIVELDTDDSLRETSGESRANPRERQCAAAQKFTPFSRTAFCDNSDRVMSLFQANLDGAIILAGGGARRMGQDKAAQMWGDQRAVDHVARLATELGAGHILVAGEVDYGYPQVRDPEPQAGPVAGLLAGLAVLGGGPGRVLILAVDAPTLRPADLAPLLAVAGPGAAFAGFPLPMVIDSAAAARDAQADWPLRRFVERAGLIQLAIDPKVQARLRGANTPEERDQLLREAGLDSPKS